MKLFSATASARTRSSSRRIGYFGTASAHGADHVAAASAISVGMRRCPGTRSGASSAAARTQPRYGGASAGAAIRNTPCGAPSEHGRAGDASRGPAGQRDRSAAAQHIPAGVLASPVQDRARRRHASSARLTHRHTHALWASCRRAVTAALQHARHSPAARTPAPRYSTSMVCHATSHHTASHAAWVGSGCPPRRCSGGCSGAPADA